MPRFPIITTACLVLACSLPGPVDAARPSASLLPETTKGYLSVPNVDDLGAKWEQTQLGQLIADPVMKPFIEDLRRQLKDKLNQTGIRLGVSLEDLDGVIGGELALAAVQPGGDKNAHALVLLVDITDHVAPARALIDKVSKHLISEGAKRETKTVGGTELVVFTIPDRQQGGKTHQAIYFIHDNQLIAADHEATALEIHARLLKPGKALQDLPSYKHIVQRCQTAANNATPQIRWFADPFGYAEVMRAVAGGRKKRGTDMLKVLNNQGFAAILAIGGQISLSTGKHELLHHTFVYAPSPANAKGEKYQLAARMLNFPNSEGLAPQPWIGRNLASYLSFNWKMQNAFQYAETLVDEVAGDKIFREVLESIEKDPNGPQINLEKELVRHLGERVTVMTDNRVPIGPKSERYLVAIDVLNASAVAKAVNKAMEADPAAKRREYDGHLIWEVINENEDIEVETLTIDGNDFGSDLEEEEEKPMIPNSAITVTGNHLVIASHVDYVVELLRKNTDRGQLQEAADYQLVQGALQELGAGQDSFRFFVRSDESYRTTYELLRQGKMPEAESVVGKALNRLLGPEEKGIVREQQIDGSKMPDYDAVRRYLGPGGVFVRSEEDGWLVTGCLLTKDAKLAR